jgi:hypothetical protein
MGFRIAQTGLIVTLLVSLLSYVTRVNPTLMAGLFDLTSWVALTAIVVGLLMGVWRK